MDPRSARIIKVCLLAVGVLAVVYAVLLIPEPAPPRFVTAGKQPFVWDQDAFWRQLEQEFLQARKTGCQKLAGVISNHFFEAEQNLARLSAGQLAPDAPAFRSLEEDLFRLAPMVAACPDRLGSYTELINSVRAEVKKQSVGWNLASTPARQTLYRLLAGSRMALEQAILQAPSDSNPSSLATRGPSAELAGVQLRSGDILVSRGGAPTSALIARGNDFPGSFSHVALLHVDENSGQASLIESHIECGVAVASWANYLKDPKLRILVLRLRPDLAPLKADPSLPHTIAADALAEAGKKHIPYDFTMDHRDHGKRFCSEVVSAAYEQKGIDLWMGISSISSPTVSAWLGSLGARYFETQEPADLEYDPQLEVVTEWHDRSALLKAHIDDAVIDVMLEEAPPGKPLAHSLWKLPFARMAKAYSVVLNLFGKIGPVPEGLSATSALRVEAFRQNHAAVHSRLATLAKDFQQKNGYLPPYWELIKLARESTHQLKPTENSSL